MMTDPFRTSDHVPDFDRHVVAYAERSAATRARLPMLSDIAYGPSPAEKLDMFLPPPHLATGAVHMFVHGGYWRMFAKEDFSFVAETVTAAGAIAVVIDYALMPSVGMATVVAQVRRARDWVRRHIPEHGGDPERFTISGHSAGAHLGALLLDASQPAGVIAGALFLSGIYDLAPLRHSFLREHIDITEDDVERFSPLRIAYGTCPAVSIMVGARETLPFHKQASDFGFHLTHAAIKRDMLTIVGVDHMRIVADLADLDSKVGTALADLVSFA